MTIAYIGMGGNLESHAGEPEATLAAAAERIGALGRMTARSRLYSTAPVGYDDQPRFLNAVVAVETVLAPAKLLHELMAIEKEFGRKRFLSLRNGPRTLDLDLLLYGDVVLVEQELMVPHPRIAERAFVLVPLAEIAPDLILPRRGKTVAELLRAIDADENAVAVFLSERWQPRQL